MASPVLRENGSWPPYLAPALRLSAPVHDQVDGDDRGYGHLASYVCTEALGRLGLAFPSGVRFQGVGPREVVGSRDEDDERVLAALYDQLQACRITYDLEPWHAAGGQLVRDPEQLLWPGGAGTCIDLCLLFAAACLSADLSVALVMLRRADGSGHAAVAVHLGVTRDQDWPVTTDVLEADEGVLAVDPEGFLHADPNVRVVDVTLASAGGSLDEALTVGSSLLRSVGAAGQFAAAHLVDVARRQRLGDHPLPRPVRRAALRTQLVAPAAATAATGLPVPQQADLLGRLRGRGGVVVLRGASGTGKSTVARTAAALVDHGHGWFVPGSTPASATAELARLELREKGLALALESEEQKALATAALNRLHGREEPWVVVLDNADSGPSGHEALLRLPRPLQGQLVIVTSTSPAASWAGYPVLEVEPLDVDTMMALVPGSGLVPASQLASLVAGRLVLLVAFRALAGAWAGFPTHLAELLKSQQQPTDPQAPADAAARRGAAAYVDLLRASLGNTSSAWLVAQLSAWLPAERLPTHLLNSMVGPDDGQEDATVLSDRGLITTDSSAYASLHRLLGDALREASDDVSRRALLPLLARGDVQALLAAANDRTVTEALEKELTAATGPDLGAALWALATAVEFHDHDGRSLRLFDRAAAHLSPDVPAERPMRADCLHAKARKVNQAGGDLELARLWMKEALELRGDTDLVGRAKHEALDALLRERQAKALPVHERVPELRDVLACLEHSWRLRAHELKPGDPLVDRAQFNLARLQLALAQAEGVGHQESKDLLGKARAVYGVCLSFRSGLYGRPNPLAASCVAGLATVDYVTAYLLQRDTDSDPSRLRQLLQSAGQLATESLEERQQLAGDGETPDTAKSNRLLLKIAAQRFLQGTPPTRRPGEWRSLVSETEDELDPLL